MASPRGQIQAGAAGVRALVFHRRYPYPIKDVWSEVTDSELLAQWFGSYQGGGVVGGTVELTMTAEEDAGGEPSMLYIHECQTPRHQSGRFS